MKIKALLFDFDETLLINEASTVSAVRASWESIQSLAPGISLDEVVNAYMSSRDEFWTRADEQIMDILQSPKEDIRFNLWKMTLEKLNLTNHELLPILVEKFGETRYNTWELYPDSLEILDQLKHEYRLVMITNGVPEIQWGKINKVNVKTYFNPIIISGEIGVSKPDPEYFKLVLNQLQLRADECVVIGDSVRNDVGGAKNTGIISVWINRDNLLPRPSIQPDFEIHALKELLPILEKLG
jgi:putative hydrolase of the HAD superfamily